MTKVRSQESLRKVPRQPGNANTACLDGSDACELLLAELEVRRKRLQKLLRLVWAEAERLPASRATARCHARRENVRIRHSA